MANRRPSPAGCHDHPLIDGIAALLDGRQYPLSGCPANNLLCVAGHLPSIKFPFDRLFPERHPPQYQGDGPCCPAWYGQAAAALPEDFFQPVD